jgi:antitoxin component of RelBE/YafQ-DinJ toxin-antitoxin module
MNKSTTTIRIYKESHKKLSSFLQANGLKSVRAVSTVLTRVIEENPKKNVYFFSYEESAAAIQIAFVNTYTSKRIHKINPNEKALSKNNKRSIESYYRGTDEFITQGLHLEFNLGQKAFFKEIIDTGKLKVIYTDMKADQLVNGIRFIKENDPNVGMIYIDYIQMLQAETPRLSRQEQLKQICLMLKDCAIETGLPIVLAAQFNRTVVSEADLSCVNIGEAGDIERIASLIIGGFNRNFHMMSKLGNTDKEGKTVPKESTIYMEVLKGRNIGAGHFCVMDFDGNKGLVTNNINYDNKTVSSEITIKEAPKNQMIT